MKCFAPVDPATISLPSFQPKNICPSFVGFYLQYILNKDVTSDKKSTYNEKRKDNLKLVGYSNSDISLLDEFIIDSKYDRNSNKMIDWIILCYKGIVGEQELVNMEPERCVGFERINPDKVDYFDMGDTAASFLDDILKNGI